jgi:hypothetical protein
MHAGLTHYVNAANTNWDELVPFFLMAYRASPNTKTRYSPFFLLHGREMALPSNEDVKAKVAKDDPNLKQRIDSLKASLKLAYRSVRLANQIIHRKNKKFYDRKAKLREFKFGDFAYLYYPAVKPGLYRKLKKKLGRVLTRLQPENPT